MRNHPPVHRVFQRQFRAIVPLLVVWLGLSALLESIWEPPAGWPKSLESIREAGVIRILVPDAPDTFHGEAIDFREFDRAVARAFAESLGVDVQLIPMAPGDAMISRLQHGDADLAAMALTRTDGARLAFSTPILQYQLTLLHHRELPKPENLEALDSPIVVAAESIEALALERVRDAGLSGLTWTTLPGISPLQLLTDVEERRQPYTAVLGPAFRQVRALFPDLEASQVIGTELPLGFGFPRSADPALIEVANQFLESETTRIDELIELHLNKPLARVADIKAFTRQVNARLPTYQPLFEAAAALVDWDWRLLAAIAYQESHLNPRAKSPTGVRGIMMLTLQTMRELGYTSRLDPAQSIEGGARYLSQLKGRIPERIADPDRTWFTLAAYNIGMGHLEDARKLTEQQGGDPDRWIDVSARLPLLEDPAYHAKTTYGFARGREAQTYVANIQQYYEWLLWDAERTQALTASTEERLQ
ncbi:MAG: membrane-bound lytic murein transglycosylase MltF [Gammaproteobacteria bacterium]|nr:membrane-bound lytic murein transglycosylase MltF [Gammaproteobacteria bacterium]